MVGIAAGYTRLAWVMPVAASGQPMPRVVPIRWHDPVWFLALIESEGASIAVIQNSMRCEMVAHLMVMFACGNV